VGVVRGYGKVARDEGRMEKGIGKGGAGKGGEKEGVMVKLVDRLWGGRKGDCSEMKSLPAVSYRYVSHKLFL
jgi:hypothetical protein